MSANILVEKQHGVIVLTLNRQNVANALNNDLLIELCELVTTIQNDKEIRCVIITGNGERAFCAGADLKERKAMNTFEVRQAVTLIRETISLIEALPQPVIAAINGVAFGGGLELALACDIRLASDSASFGLTETSLAIIPGAGGTQRLPRLIGIAKAKELILTAKRITSIEAESIGLISKSVSQDKLLHEAISLAEIISNNGPIAVQQAKKAIRLGMETDLQTGLQIEALCYAETIATTDRLEGLQAFSEKRKPVYKGE